MKVLFISSNRIGDAILTTGVLAWLERKHPQASFTIVSSPLTADLFRAVPRLEKLIILKKKKHHLHWLDLWKECVGTRWDLIVDFRNSITPRLLRSKRKVYANATNKGEHKVEEFGSLFDLAPPPSPTIWTDEKAEAEAATLTYGKGPLIALAPAANWAPKQWPIEKFVRLADELVGDDGVFSQGRLLVIAAPHERSQVEPLLKALPQRKIIDLIGPDLLTIAACLKKADLFVGNDSGLMHIAAAVGAPTIGLFGPGYEHIYGPWGRRTAVVRTPESREELLAQLPSLDATGPQLMQSLSVESVMECVLNMLDPILLDQEADAQANSDEALKKQA